MIDPSLIESIEVNTKIGTQKDIESAPVVPRKTVLVTVPSGEIRTESGADATYLVFDCDCLDALPWCKAQCCSLKGTVVHMEELTELLGKTILNDVHGRYEMKRECDGFCTCLDRDKRLCTIYEQRPQTCQDFHCSRGLQRGWPLPNTVSRVEH
ncbi:YkgJ family cysteine cluster protein [Floridanema evergladense]|uniref:YkgJ family cysteine cluster protein n=1 Tax=Floridaenema evergladense BLCC-F167 TaxID=3153639 RepID=A0ABV4WEI2_9CYAN